MTDHKPHKAAVTMRIEPMPFLVLETPHEAKTIVEDGLMVDAKFVEFTNGNEDGWNGKTIYVDPKEVIIVTPPMTLNTNDDDD